MYLGYVKAGRLDETDQLYKSKLETLRVQKVFSDSKYERTALKELLGYVRQGDSIVVESILDLSISAGEFIELAIKLFRQGVFVVCINQQIDTSLATWGSILGVLSVFENDTPQGTRGRPTRMIEDIEEYYKQVKDGKVTVDEVCEKLGIGKSTFYRNLRRMGDIKLKPQKMTHTEKFAEYEELVKAGKISVAESCRQMNIAVSTYYELRKRANRKSGAAE